MKNAFPPAGVTSFVDVTASIGDPVRCGVGIHGNEGYRGNSYPDRFKVCISGQAPRVAKSHPPRDTLAHYHRYAAIISGARRRPHQRVLLAAGLNFSLLLRCFKRPLLSCCNPCLRPFAALVWPRSR